MSVRIQENTRKNSVFEQLSRGNAIFTKNLHRRCLSLTDIKMQNESHHNMISNFISHQNNIACFNAWKRFA